MGLPTNGFLESIGTRATNRRRPGSLGFDPLYLADGKKSEFLTQVDLPKGPGTGDFLGGPGVPNANTMPGVFLGGDKKTGNNGIILKA